MADMNEVIVTGVIPGFDNAFRIWNENDESKAFARVSISSQTSRKGDDGHYIDDIIEIAVFGKTAINLKKFIRKGQGLWFRGHVTPSRKRRNQDGTDALDANGKPIYTGLGVTAYTFGPMRNYAERNNNGAQAPRPAAPAAAAFDPLADTTTTAATAGGSEDSNAWPF